MADKTAPSCWRCGKEHHPDAVCPTDAPRTLRRWANTGPNGEMQVHPLGEFVLLKDVTEQAALRLRERIEQIVQQFWEDRKQYEITLTGYVCEYFRRAALAAATPAQSTPLGKCLGHVTSDGEVEWADGTPTEGTLLYDRQWTEAEIAEGVRRGKVVWDAAQRDLQRQDAPRTLRELASRFGARVFERNPEWERETGTDFAEARDELTAALRAATPPSTQDNELRLIARIMTMANRAHCPEDFLTILNAMHLEILKKAAKRDRQGQP